VSNVELKQIDLPQEMQRAMARQAEAERERRSKVISAEGEYQASQRLADAAEILERQPSALTLRYPPNPGGNFIRTIYHNNISCPHRPSKSIYGKETIAAICFA
jgi:hypothetical protein